MSLKRLVAAAAVLGSLVALPAMAQGMMGGYFQRPADPAATAETARDEASGKAVWDRLQAKQISCADLTDDDFDLLGDYFMGLMMGGSHAAMNESLAARFGDSGERQMHVAMGKRMSGCDASATLPAEDVAFFPMMGRTGGMMGWASGAAVAAGPYGMMGWASGGWPWVHVLACIVTVVLVWTALVLSIVALWKWIKRQK